MGSRDGTPVELDGTANSVNAAAENDGLVIVAVLLVEGNVVGRCVVCSVKIVRVGREFRGKCVNSLGHPMLVRA